MTEEQVLVKFREGYERAKQSAPLIEAVVKYINNTIMTDAHNRDAHMNSESERLSRIAKLRKDNNDIGCLNNHPSYMVVDDRLCMQRQIPIMEASIQPVPPPLLQEIKLNPATGLERMVEISL